jgi:hypothetical protein
MDREGCVSCGNRNYEVPLKFKKLEPLCSMECVFITEFDMYLDRRFGGERIYLKFKEN